MNDVLSRNASSNEIFDNTKEDHQKALDKSGYKTKLLYKENNSNNNKEKNSINNTSKKQVFLKLLDQHFPKTKTLHKIFSCNPVKNIS